MYHGGRLVGRWKRVELSERRDVVTEDHAFAGRNAFSIATIIVYKLR